MMPNSWAAVKISPSSPERYVLLFLLYRIALAPSTIGAEFVRNNLSEREQGIFWLTQGEK